MVDLFSLGKDPFRAVSAYLPPFNRRSFYRVPEKEAEEEGETLLPNFAEALQKLMQIHIHGGGEEYGGFTSTRDAFAGDYPRFMRNDFSPSLLDDVYVTDRFSTRYFPATGELRCARVRDGALSPCRLPDDGSPGPVPALLFSLLAWAQDHLETVGERYARCLDAFSSFRSAYITGERTLSLEKQLRTACLELQRTVRACVKEDGPLKCRVEEGVLPLPEPGDGAPVSEDPAPEAGEPLRVSSLAGAFRPDPDRELTAEEASLIPDVPSWYDVPPQVLLAAKAVKETSGDGEPFRNLLFRGDAGTGKTEGARILAALCGLPYLFLTCSADSEIYDLLMQVIPEPSSSGGLSYRYVDSPLVRAVEKGYLLEIQEPSVISKPGVLAGLNALWDRLGTIRLMDGRVIRRHPDSVIVLTTNASYEGCRRMNQSVISRQHLIMDFDLPDDDALIGRICSVSGLGDRKTVEKMLKVKRAADSILSENGVSDGDTGVRQLIHWASLTRVTGDPYLAGMNTLIPGATADAEVRVDLIQALESQFSPSGRGRSRNFA